ncbi:MAG: alpha/beta hydrolase [Spirochaetales bacterium]|nr:alpha/beta hydrolase [Spirochaetales bacterium]
MKSHLKFIFKLLILISFNVFFSCTTFVDGIADNYMNSDIEYFEYNDLKIRYSDTGSGTPIIFLHGLGASSFTWRYLYKYYSLEYRVISLDLKGFGDSSKPNDNDYRISDQAKIIQKFINEKNLSNVTLIGNSYGGSVALSTFANADTKTKGKISNMILIDPAAYRQEKMPGYISLLQTPLINKLTLYISPKNLIAKIILKLIFYNDSLITDEMVLTYGNLLKDGEAHNALIQTAIGVSDKETSDISSLYKQINIPVLIIWGNNDKIIEKNDGIKLNNDLPKSELVILDDCGHIPQEEQPEITINVINNFLESSSTF